MLSVIVTTEGIEHAAVATLSALVPGAAAGLIREVLLVDRGASDAIARVADVAGCGYVAANGSRAAALAAGAAQARSPWLLFVRAGAVLDPGWIEETAQFLQGVASSGVPRAGIFSAVHSPYAQTTWRDWLGAVVRALGQPSAGQGLLIAREHYDRLGGHRIDSDEPERQLMRRLGASRMRLRSRIVMM